jgi:xyloglucan-specific exo-beta-1,4-glucanase
VGGWAFWSRVCLAAAGMAALCLPLAAAANEGAAEAYEWRNVTVGAGGFAPNIVFSRAEPDLAYLRTDMGGAYRWDERVQRWIPLQDGNPVSSYMGIESIAADPKNPDVVYLAAGMGRWGEASIWRSGDRGSTWTVYEVPFKMGGNEPGRGLGERLAIDPAHPSTLLFGSRHDGLQRSDDAGRTWRKVSGFPHGGLGLPANPREAHGGISFVLFDSQSPAIYAAVADPAERHLYRSIDGGESWAAVPGGPAPELLPVKGDIDAAGNLYIAYATGIGPNDIADGAVWRLDTRSGEWSDITPDPAGQGGYMGLSVDRRKAGRLAVSSVNRWQPGDTVWVSGDHGRTWDDLSPRSRRDTSVTPFLNWGEEETDFGHWTAGLAIDPFDGGTIVYTTGDTVYRTDGGDKPEGPIQWSPWVRGIEQTAVITLISPTGGAPVISGFGDLAGFVHDGLDVSPPGMHLEPRLPNTNNLDYAGLAPQIVVRSGTARWQSPSGASLAWSDDGGHTWQALRAPKLVLGDEPARRYDLGGEAPINVSADGAVFIVGTPMTLVTRDRGKTWAVPDGLPAGVRAIADKADPALFYAVDFAGSRLYVSHDGARTFEPAAAAGLPATLVRVGRTDREAQSPLVATPGSAGEIWLLSGHRLYRSRDAGGTFQLASADDLGIELFGLGKPTPGRDDPAVYAVGTEADKPGVWRSDDGGATWLRINDDAHQWGLRFRAISGDPRRNGRVYIATDGRGLLYGDPATGNQE